MSPFRTLRFCIVGESRLIAHCLQYLQERGHTICGVVTPNLGYESFPRFASLNDARSSLSTPPDVLLSIVNRRILSKELLQWPLFAAINYHNSALPSFAGVSASSAAILANSEQHGITWHLMDSVYDAGDILVQRVFQIGAEATALSLNAQCYEAAIESFPELLAQLESGHLIRQPQNPAKRSVHRFCDRLPCHGLIDWTRPVTEILRMIRAAACEPHENLIGTVALLLNQSSAVRVRSATLLTESSSADTLPGTVLSSRPGRLQVAALGGILQLTLARRSFLPGLADSDPELVPGCRLPRISDTNLQYIATTSAVAVLRETETVRQLETLPPPLRPVFLKYGIATTVSHLNRRCILRIDCRTSAEQPSVIATLLTRLAVAAEQTTCAVAVICKHQIPAFLPWVPFIVNAVAPTETASRLRDCLEATPISDDLFLRYPQLRPVALRLGDLRVFITSDPPSEVQIPGLLIHFTEHGVFVSVSSEEIADDNIPSLLEIMNGFETKSESSASTPDVIAQFLSVSEQFPDDLCVEHCEAGYSRSHIEQLARKVAASLKHLGAGPESRVMLVLRPTAEFVASLLGTLMTGAAFVPIDFDTPRNRISEIILDCRPLCVITESDGPSFSDIAVCRTFEQLSTTLPSVTELRFPPEQSAAYLIYTSGSTGTPKGAVIERRSLNHFIHTVIQRHGLQRTDRVLQLCATGFDASVEEIFTSLCSGATLILKPPHLLDSASQFLHWIDERRLTIIGLYPAMLSAVLTVMERQRFFPPSVRIITTGGEPIPMPQVERWRNFFATLHRNSPALLNVYGLTETTIANFMCDLAESGDPNLPAPIGQPLPGNRWQITRNEHPGRINEASGELLIAGCQTARCYWEQTLSQKRFLLDFENVRWFRTGDLAEILPDGQLAIRGRSDQQIKISGVRIEPEEVERVLLAADGVAQATVLSIKPAAGNEQVLCACISPDEPEVLLNAMRHAQQFLTPAMLPRRFVGVPVTPTTDRGKIDRQSLALRLQQQFSQENSSPEQDFSQLEMLWQKALGSFPAANADFVQSGGDSLAAMKLLLDLEHATGRRIAVSAFLENPTFSHLQSLITSHSAPLFVTLKSGASSTSLVFLHGITGDIAEFQSVADRMSFGGAIYGIRSRICSNPNSSPQTITEFAEEALAELEKHFRGKAPIFAGWSWGGLVAWELGQLYFRRHRVRPCIVLVDTWCPGRFNPSWPHRIRHAIRQIPYSISLAFQRLPTLVARPRELSQHERNLQQLLATRQRQQLITIGNQHQPTPDTDANVHLLKATNIQLGPRAWAFPQALKDNGWSHITGSRPTIHRRNCTHTDMVWGTDIQWTADRLTKICEHEATLKSNEYNP